MLYVCNVLRNTRYMQYVCVLTAALSVGCFAMNIGWASVSLPKLTSDNSPIGIKLNSTQSSWITSIPTLGGILGFIIAGFLLNRVGRKYSIIVGGLVLFAAWIATACVKIVELLITARFISGIAGGIISAVVPIYIGEMAETDVRGRLGVVYNILNVSGNVFVLCIGPFVSYTLLSICCGSVTLLFLILFALLPDSPYYLMQKQNIDGARIVLKRLLPSTTDESDIENRLNEIERFVTNVPKMKLSVWEILSTVNYRKSLLIVVGLNALEVLSGYTPIRSYLHTIIASSGSSISLEISSILIGVVQLPAVLVAAATIDKMGRKPLLLISTVGCSVTLIAEGVYFYLESVNINTDSISWLPTTGLCMYLIMLPLGITTIPAVMSGELFATRVKSLFPTVIGIISLVLTFAITFTFEPISLAWGMFTMFWIYGGICIFACFLILIFLPETKGKSFIEIQNKLSN